MSSRLKIEDLARLGHPLDGDQKIFCMLASYLDESGIHGGSKIGKLCVIAGYFGESRAWRGLERDWRKALRDHLVPLDKFHAKDFIRRKGFFGTFGHQSYLRLLYELLKAITGHKIFPVVSSVVVSDFTSFSLNERRFLTGAKVKSGRFITSGCPSKPYFLPFQHCIGTVSKYAPGKRRIHFFFGLDRTFSEYATDLFRQLKLTVGLPYRDKLGGPSFPLAKETPQLQAADFLAYSVYADMEVRFGHWERDAPPELRVAISQKKSKHDFKYIDAATMRALMNGVNIPK